MPKAVHAKNITFDRDPASDAPVFWLKWETIKRVRDAVYAWTEATGLDNGPFDKPREWEIWFEQDPMPMGMIGVPPRAWFWIVCPLPIDDRLAYQCRMTVPGALAWALAMEWRDRICSIRPDDSGMESAIVESDRRLTLDAENDAWALALYPDLGGMGLMPAAPFAAWIIAADVGRADFIAEPWAQRLMVAADIVAFAGPEPLRRWLAEPEKHIEEMLMVLAWATEEWEQAQIFRDPPSPYDGVVTPTVARDRRMAVILDYGERHYWDRVRDWRGRRVLTP